MKKLIAILLIGFMFLPAHGLMMGTKNVPIQHDNSTQIYDLGGGIFVKGSGYSSLDNPYQCPNSGDITSISCKGFAALHDDLQSIIEELIQLVAAENANTAELKKICLVESEGTQSMC